MPDQEEPQNLTIARMVLAVELTPEGHRQFSMNINVHGEDAPTYEPSPMYDLNAMLGFAGQNLGNPDWLAVAYAEDEDGPED